MSIPQAARDARRRPPDSAVDTPQVLAGRLATGWLMCDQERDPTKKQKLEEHWIRLVHKYETACSQDSETSIMERRSA